MNYNNYQRGQVVFDNEMGYRETVIHSNRFIAIISCIQSDAFDTTRLYRIEYMNCIALASNTNKVGYTLSEAMDIVVEVMEEIIEDRKTPLYVFPGDNGYINASSPYRRHYLSDLSAILANGGTIIDAITKEQITEKSLDEIRVKQGSKKS